MRAYLATLIISMSFANAVWAMAPDAEVLSIKVRLFSFSKSVELRGVGIQLPKKPQSVVGVALPQGETVQISLNTHNQKPVWNVKRSGSAISEIYAGPELKLSSQELKKGAQALPKELKFWAQGERVDVVAEIPLEDYLLGVVASEVPPGWPVETLKAQTVAARSYAMSVMRERAKLAYHVDSTILDQVYRHMSKGEAQSERMAQVQEAVRSTRGQFLSVGKLGKPLKAFFHADCGGKTTTPKNVWNGGVNGGQTVDHSCPASPKSNWVVKLERAELEKRLGVVAIKDIQLVNIPGEERVLNVKIVGSTTKVVSSNKFRELIGYQILKSALFELTQNGSNFTFTGRGFGHGVGLCQWGSRHLGKQGFNYKQILGHYYPLAHLRSLKL